MKRMLFAVFATLSLVCSAQTPAALRLSKAKALILKELKGTLHDYSSYEPVNWSSVDSVFSVIEDDPNVCRRMDNLLEKHSKLPGDPSKLSLFSDLSSLEEKCKEAYEKSKNLDFGTQYQFTCLNQWIAVSDFNRARVKAQEAINNFKPQFVGWSLSHRFRAKNAVGAKVISQWTFFFDPEIQNIESIVKE